MTGRGRRLAASGARGRLLLVGMLALLAAPPSFSTASSSGSFALNAALSNGAQAATSASYRLTGCLSQGPAGTSGSGSYRLVVGCAALAAGTTAEDDGTGTVPVELERFSVGEGTD